MFPRFEKDFEDFAEAHFDLFETAVDLKLGDEHSLEYHKVWHEKFVNTDEASHRLATNCAVAIFAGLPRLPSYFRGQSRTIRR